MVTELYLPPATDPDLAVRIGEEALSSCPYLYLPRRRAVVINDAYSETPYLILKLKGYVYDHRYEPEMISGLTRRCKRVFRRLGLLEDWKEMGG